MVDDYTAQTVSVACLHVKILEEQVHPPLPTQLQQLKIWYNSFLLSSCAVKVQTHYWEKASQPAWSACWALRCIWSPQGCPWKTVTLNSLWTPDRRMPNTAPPTEGAVLSFSLLKKTKTHFYMYHQMSLTTPTHEDSCHLMYWQIADFHPRRWWCWRLPGDGHTPAPPRPF